MNLINLLITSIFSSNIVLSRFLGICPFMGSSKSVKNAINMGLSVIFVVTLSSILSYFIYYNSEFGCKNTKKQPIPGIFKRGIITNHADS